MRVDAEEIKKQLMDKNQMKGGMFKIDNDPVLQNWAFYSEN